MTREELIRAALAYDEATEDYPFGDDLLTVKVGGRVFAWIPLTDSGCGQRLPGRDQGSAGDDPGAA